MAAHIDSRLNPVVIFRHVDAPTLTGVARFRVRRFGLAAADGGVGARTGLGSAASVLAGAARPAPSAAPMRHRRF